MSWGLLFDATSFIQHLPSYIFMKLRSIDILLASAELKQASLCVQLGRMFPLTSSVNFEPSDDSLRTV